ncbi:MAG: DUF951 domain-containing protein [Chloroflexi bacterium]|nr:DUF951 domain-containing protein [Chloroflexota bacterium]
MPIPFSLNQRVRLRKPHPCGSTDWVVVRLGADIGLKCEGCGRRVLLPRRELEKRLKQILPPQAPLVDTSPASDPAP